MMMASVFMTSITCLNTATLKLALPLHKLLMNTLLFNHRYEPAVYIAYVKRFVDLQSPINQELPQISLVETQLHMGELCPKKTNSFFTVECWCGFINKAGDEKYPFATRPFVMMKICHQLKSWAVYKDKTIQKFLNAFNMVRDENGKMYDFHQARKETLIDRDLKINQILQFFKDSIFYKHDESVCPEGFKWCWCGYVNTLDEYNGEVAKLEYPIASRVLVDCRPYEKRPFEKRNCKPDAKNIPFYRSILGLGPEKFPCGSFEPSN